MSAKASAPASASAPVTAPGRANSTRWALPTVLVCFGVVISGFVGTYFVPVVQGRFTGGPLLHFHGALFFAWFALLIAQSVLVRRGLPTVHKALGIVGAALAFAMIASAITIETSIARAALEAGRAEEAHVGLLLTASNAFLFAVLFSGAVCATPWPQTHRRLMVLAALSIVPIALQRVFFSLGLPGIGGIAAAALVADLAALGLVVVDARARGRAHVALVVGLAIMLAVQIGRVGLLGTDGWAAFAEGLARVWPGTPG